ncbi:MAG: hypothetical protein ABN490_22215, partial [Pantoea agglomerans]
FTIPDKHVYLCLRRGELPEPIVRGKVEPIATLIRRSSISAVTVFKNWLITSAAAELHAGRDR